MMRHLTLAFVLFLVGAGRPAAAQRPAALERKLQQRISVAWQGQDRGAALERLRVAEDLPFWIDRRVDLSASVDAKAADRPLREVFTLLGAEGEFTATPYRGVIYFGPRRTGESLPALAQTARAALAKSSQAVRRRWLDPAPWSFPELSEPRKLVAAAVEHAGAQLAGVDRVPHDLWTARSLPALAPIDQAVLVLVGFDLTLEISADGRSARIVPIDFTALSRVAVRPRLDLPPDRRDRQASPESAETKVFTLKIDDQPVGPVIDQLAEQLQLTVIWDQLRGAGRETAGAVKSSCDVRKATLDKLLEALLTPAGLAFEREGTSVTIHALR